MGFRVGHANHVIRVAGLFAAGFLAFLILRSALIPSDFGVHGFYRAGALDDNRNRPLLYSGEAPCVECHSDVGDLRKAGAHAQVRCEACHGPLARHASGEFDIRPRALNPRTLCLGCHLKQPGTPAAFPQILPADHSESGPCSGCHRPHRPGFDPQRP
ncbi:MAG TPA: cytochrome c3 family protein [Vicinamibacterales bacterium]|nr:cytochrome c3 family protein [Vicinamibacterales bacterium]